MISQQSGPGSVQSGPGSKQSTILRFCVAIVSLVVIVGTAGSYFSNVVESAKTTEAQAAVASFASSVIRVHRNWLMQGKVNNVKLTSLDDSGKPAGPWFFLVNSKGWPINDMTANKTSFRKGVEKPDCKALWFALQKNQRLDYTGQALRMMVDEFGRLTEIKEFSFSTKEQITWVCQNLVAQQLLFRYRLDTGKVELLSKG